MSVFEIPEHRDGPEGSVAQYEFRGKTAFLGLTEQSFDNLDQSFAWLIRSQSDDVILSLQQQGSGAIAMAIVGASDPFALAGMFGRRLVAFVIDLAMQVDGNRKASTLLGTSLSASQPTDPTGQVGTEQLGNETLEVLVVRQRR